MPDSNDAYVISRKGVHNTYYIFGGRDERSQDLVQGFTASGFLFDEVALMPRSFVEQACARCSVDGAKLWFNCNPDGPFHWFKLEWLDKLKEKNALHIHFLMTDNPSLSQKTLDVYKRRYSGIFYDRFILGLWVMAEGVIYSMFKKSFILHKVPADVKINKRWVGVDYGQANATVFLLIGLGSDNKLYILDEYYHEGKSADVQYSPRGYSKQYFKWLIKNGVEGVPVQREHVFIDPSAKGFITQLREDGERKIREADNEVLKGIEMTSSLLEANMLYVLSKCEYTIREFSAYRWDAKAQTERGEDIPVKQNDHCMDALRYVVNGNRMLLKTLLKTRIQQEVKQGLINKNIA
jgi:PBSX family phage terminase large subunit